MSYPNNIAQVAHTAIPVMNTNLAPILLSWKWNYICSTPCNNDQYFPNPGNYVASILSK